MLRQAARRSLYRPTNRALSTSTARMSPSAQDSLRISLRGRDLLEDPVLNKGSAFTKREREDFGLTCLLPSAIDSLDTQIDRAWSQLQVYDDKLQSYTFLSNLHNQNETLFFALCQRHLQELLPIIYTPTASEAIKSYSKIFHRPDGLFFTQETKGRMREAMFQEKKPEDVDLIIVSDAEAILGIGDQGVGGIVISVAKGYIYALGAGINPSRILPIILDVGTNNQTHLDDPLYLGVRKPRLRGAEYDALLDELAGIVKTDYQASLLHFEDFGKENAARLLEKYRGGQKVFNDDMQGTAAVVVAGLRSACQVAKTELKDQKVVVYGFGSAGLGIADGIHTAMVDDGANKDEAYNSFWAIDADGLLLSNTKDLRPGQEKYTREKEEVEEWEKGEKGYELLETIKRVKPTVLIGVSTEKEAFSEEVVREMAKHTDRPIIFPLSNPTKLTEVTPENVEEWTEGKGLVAVGSPFPPIKKGDKEYPVAEANNALIYPGLSLGTIISRATHLSDKMMSEGIKALAEMAPALKSGDNKDALLPGLEDLRHVSATVALAVANAARREKLSTLERTEDFTLEDIKKEQWQAVYREYVAVEK